MGEKNGRSRKRQQCLHAHQTNLQLSYWRRKIASFPQLAKQNGLGGLDVCRQHHNAVARNQYRGHQKRQKCPIKILMANLPGGKRYSNEKILGLIEAQNERHIATNSSVLRRVFIGLLELLTLSVDHQSGLLHQPNHHQRKSKASSDGFKEETGT
ncbi:hypothetical protein JTB14_036147 [Gonioctena quinquepunctata]|nr:hypothetical protein JTB14_036147 [Gonioctena quinquepunctata]